MLCLPSDDNVQRSTFVAVHSVVVRVVKYPDFRERGTVQQRREGKSECGSGYDPPSELAELVALQVTYGKLNKPNDADHKRGKQYSPPKTETIDQIQIHEIPNAVICQKQYDEHKRHGQRNSDKEV